MAEQEKTRGQLLAEAATRQFEAAKFRNAAEILNNPVLGPLLRKRAEELETIAVMLETLAAKAPRESIGESDAPAKKILIIDDDSAVRFTLKKILMGAGYEVIVAVDGKSALQLFNLERPDLVITDIIMPVQEGIETIIALKSLEPSTRIVAISGGGRISQQDLLRMAGRLGADAVMQKPFREEELIKVVKEKLAA